MPVFHAVKECRCYRPLVQQEVDQPEQRQDQLDPPVIDDRLVVHAAGAVQQHKPPDNVSVGLCPSLPRASIH